MIQDTLAWRNVPDAVRHQEQGYELVVWGLVAVALVFLVWFYRYLIRKDYL